MPDGLRGLVTACLVKEPEQRPSLADVLAMIEDAADGAPQETPAGRVEPWLPGAIVAQLGRHAVQLLELEAEAEVETEVPATAAVGTGSSGGAAMPPVAAAPTMVPGRRPAAEAAESAPGTDGAAPPPDPGPGVPADAPAKPAEPQEPPAARRFGPGALVAVLALLAVIAGSTTAYVVVRQSGGGGGHGSPPAAADAPAGTTAPSQTAAPTPAVTEPGAAPATVTPSVTASDTATPSSTPPAEPAAPVVPVEPPDDLVGTWVASYTSAPGITDTRTLTVREDGSVQLTGQRTDGTQTLYHCVWSMSVTGGGPPAELSPSLVVSGKPAASCQPGTTSTTLTLLDDTHLRRDGVAGEKAPPTYGKTG